MMSTILDKGGTVHMILQRKSIPCKLVFICITYCVYLLISRYHITDLICICAHCVWLWKVNNDIIWHSSAVADRVRHRSSCLGHILLPQCYRQPNLIPGIFIFSCYCCCCSRFLHNVNYEWTQGRTHKHILHWFSQQTNKLIFWIVNTRSALCLHCLILGKVLEFGKGPMNIFIERVCSFITRLAASVLSNRHIRSLLQRIVLKECLTLRKC